jgi:ketosteroid isomerase-like protein
MNQSSEENLATITLLYEALAARDVATIQTLFAEDVVIFQTPRLPWGGEHRGHEGLFTFFLTLVDHIESQVEIEDLFTAGDHVVQRGRTRGTVTATGAAFDISEVHVFELRDGKIVRYNPYIDTPAMLAALELP